jgi:hypothetical protein
MERKERGGLRACGGGLGAENGVHTKQASDQASKKVVGLRACFRFAGVMHVT